MIRRVGVPFQLHDGTWIEKSSYIQLESITHEGFTSFKLGNYLKPIPRVSLLQTVCHEVSFKDSFVASVDIITLATKEVHNVKASEGIHEF